LSFREAHLESRITTAWDPPLLDHQDRVPRQESYIKDFRPLPLGTLHLSPGRGTLRLRAPKVAGAQVADVFLLTLERSSNQP
jgi:hypothetical protein